MAPLKPIVHHNTIVLRGLRGALNWSPFMPRHVSQCKFLQSGNIREKSTIPAQNFDIFLLSAKPREDKFRKIISFHVQENEAFNDELCQKLRVCRKLNKVYLR